MKQTEREELINNSFRLLKRTAYCRLCGEHLAPSTEVLSYYPYGSNDTSAQICVPCLETIAEIVNEKKASVEA